MVEQATDWNLDDINSMNRKNEIEVQVFDAEETDSVEDIHSMMLEDQEQRAEETNDWKLPRIWPPEVQSTRGLDLRDRLAVRYEYWWKIQIWCQPYLRTEHSSLYTVS